MEPKAAGVDDHESKTKMIDRESVGTGWPEILHTGLEGRDRHPVPKPEADRARASDDASVEAPKPRPDGAERSTAPD